MGAFGDPLGAFREVLGAFGGFGSVFSSLVDGSVNFMYFVVFYRINVISGKV